MGTRKPAGKRQTSSAGTGSGGSKPAGGRPKTIATKPHGPRRTGTSPDKASTRPGRTMPTGTKIRIQGRDEYYILRAADPGTGATKKSRSPGARHDHPPGLRHPSIWCETCRAETPEEGEDTFFFVKTGGGKPTPDC